MTDSPHCFVAYSWESEDHKQWVLDLATRLRRDGVDVVLDLWLSLPGDSLTKMMETEVRESDFVLMICTPTYKKKLDERQGGAGYEGEVIMGERFAGVSPSAKFVPILRSGSWHEAAPSALLGTFYVSMTADEVREEDYQLLLSTLLGDGPELPPLGSVAPRGSDWIPLELARLPHTEHSSASLLVALENLCLAAKSECGSEPAAFTTLLRASQVSPVDMATGDQVRIPTFDFLCHYRNVTVRLEEFHTDLLAAVAELALGGGTEERSLAVELMVDNSDPLQRWQLDFPQSLELSIYWLPLRVEYEPTLRRVTIRELDGRRNLREYRSRLRDTSEALEFFAATTSGGAAVFESLDALEESPSAMRMVAYLVDTMSVDHSPFRVLRSNPEVWDFEYGAFDAEVEERRRAEGMAGDGG